MKITSNSILSLFKNIIYVSIFCLGFSPVTFGQTQDVFDIVLNGGRVIDPETKFDSVANVGIKKGRIMVITSDPINGKETIDVSGLIVSPGFIDLHVHGIGNTEQEYQVHDGVTTALELEVGLPFLKDWYSSRTSKALINYGASVNWAISRVEAIGGFDEELVGLKEILSNNSGQGNPGIFRPFGKSVYENLSDDQITKMLASIKLALNDGALGIGIPVGYLPGASREEVFRVYQLAGELQVPIFTHVREGGTVSIQQAISNAVLTNAPLHIEHINSMALNEIELAIEMVNIAQKRGFNITTEVYPYTAASTELRSAMFDEGWQKKFGIGYNDLQWVATGERLTEESFLKYRKTGGNVIMYIMKPEWITAGIASKNTMIASDGMTYAKLAHPRTAGTFSRVLGKYVREEKVLDLNEALEKMTLLPAKRLENISPMMKLKGRLQVGADADITIFDADKVIDKATFENGLEFSDGIEYVLVDGVPVIKAGKTVANTFPGQPVYSRYKK